MQYDKSFKEEALKLSDEIGIKAATTQLEVYHITRCPGGVTIEKNTELICIVAVVINGCLQILQNSVSGNQKKKT